MLLHLHKFQEGSLLNPILGVSVDKREAHPFEPTDVQTIALVYVIPQERSESVEGIEKSFPLHQKLPS